MDQPLTPPPEGDARKSPTLIGVTAVITIFAALIVWLRIYVRMALTRKTWWDDWTMFIASVRSIFLLMVLALTLEAYYDNRQCFSDRIVSLWRWQTLILSLRKPSGASVQMAMGCRTKKPLCCVPCPSFHQSILPSNCTEDEKSVQMGHLEYNRDNDHCRYLRLDKLFHSVSANSESLEARASRQLSHWSRLCRCALVLSRYVTIRDTV